MDMLNLSQNEKDRIILSYMKKYDLSYLQAKDKLEDEIWEADYQKFLEDARAWDIDNK